MERHTRIRVSRNAGEFVLKDKANAKVVDRVAVLKSTDLYAAQTARPTRIRVSRNARGFESRDKANARVADRVAVLKSTNLFAAQMV